MHINNRTITSILRTLIHYKFKKNDLELGNMTSEQLEKDQEIVIFMSKYLLFFYFLNFEF